MSAKCLICRPNGRDAACPLCPSKRTCNLPAAMSAKGPIGDIGQEIYLREEQKPEALAGQTAISGIDRHDIIQMAIEPM